LDIRICTEGKEIQKLRNYWEILCHHPNSDLDHFLLVCNLRKDVISPWVFCVNEGDGCKAIIAGRIEETILGPKIGYLKLPGIKVRSLEIINEGVLGQLGKEATDAFCNELLKTFREYRIQIINFNNLSDKQSAIWEALGKLQCLQLGLRNPNWKIHRALFVSKDSELILKKMSSKHRSWIKNREKKLNEALEGNVNWFWQKEFNDLEKIFTKMEAVAKHTYQRGLGAGFVDNEETRQRLSMFAKRGMLRVMLLEGAGKPISFWYGILLKNTFYASATGYLPEMAKYEVGTVTLLKLIKELSQEGVSRLDYGLGDADYKRRFSDESWREATIRIFAKNTKGRMIKNYFMLAEFLDRKLRNIVEKKGAVSRIKKKWRALVKLKTQE